MKVFKVFNDQELAALNKLIDTSKLVDGAATAKGAAVQKKNNLQITSGNPDYAKISPFVSKALMNPQIKAYTFMQKLLSPRVAVYREGGHYDWHVDCADEPFGEDAHDNFKGKIRKLSCIINLSDGDKFEGGDLFIAHDQSSSPDRKINRITELRKQGSVIVFPSYTHHKVSPVKKGKRHSLVAWSIGQPWK